MFDNANRSWTQALLLVFQCRADERCKQRMRLQRLGLEFRMELAAEEPRMLGRLDNFHIIFVWRPSRNFQSRRHQRFLEVAVEFIAMAVALADFELTVRLVRKGARFEFAGPRA